MNKKRRRKTRKLPSLGDCEVKGGHSLRDNIEGNTMEGDREVQGGPSLGDNIKDGSTVIKVTAKWMKQKRRQDWEKRIGWDRRDLKRRSKVRRKKGSYSVSRITTGRS